MADEREWQAWQHTAQLSAMIANAHRDPKQRAKPFLPGEFHPLLLAEKKRRANRQKAPITVLRDVFVEGRMPDLMGE